MPMSRKRRRITIGSAGPRNTMAGMRPTIIERLNSLLFRREDPDDWGSTTWRVRSHRLHVRIPPEILILHVSQLPISFL